MNRWATQERHLERVEQAALFGLRAEAARAVDPEHNNLCHRVTFLSIKAITFFEYQHWFYQIRQATFVFPGLLDLGDV